jgi:hypothetical protein
MKLAHVATPALLLLALAFGPACTSGDTRGGNTLGDFTFEPEVQVEDGTSVSLRGRLDPLAPDRFVVDVVARGTVNLHGAAFRVTWDADALGFVEARSGPPWSKNALALAKEGAPGQLAVAWSERGETGIDATDAILGTLVFQTKPHRGTRLSFKTERSQLVDKKGTRLDAHWHSGTLIPR